MEESPVSNGRQGNPVPPTPPGPSSSTPRHHSPTLPPFQPPPLSLRGCPLPDAVYLEAADIFQRLHVDKPITYRLLHYGEKTDTPAPESRDMTTKEQAYQLAFSTLKYQDLLESVITDSCFHTSQQISEDLLPLAMAMLCDFMHRNFEVNKRPSNEPEGPSQEVRGIESCLQRWKTKLAASLACHRVKHSLRSVSCVLSEPVRTKHLRAKLLPRYAWVNTLRNSVEGVCQLLQGEGVRQVASVSELKECGFTRDPVCPDTLVFPPQGHEHILSKLTAEHVLNMQDRSACVAVNSLRPVLSSDSDVMVVGSFSAVTVAHIAVLAAACLGRVLVCGDDQTPVQREETQDLLTSMDIKNVHVLSQEFHGVGEWDSAVARLRVTLVLPRCSSSALSEPVGTILREHGDCDLLQDLSRGSASPEKIHTMTVQQARLLTHSLTFPKVQTVLYCTRSVYAEENEQLVKRVLEKVFTPSKLLPFRVSGPIFPEAPGPRPAGDQNTGKFFRIEPSEHTSGCFVARLTREADPAKVESVQDILARAAAKGLLGGIFGEPSKPLKQRRRKSSIPAAKDQSHLSSGERQVLTQPHLVIGQDPGGNSSTLPVILSSLKERGEADDEGSEEDGLKGSVGGDEGKAEKSKGSRRRRKGRPKQQTKRPRKTSKVSKSRPSRAKEKAATRNVKLAHDIHAPNRSQLPTLTPSPISTRLSSPMTPLPDPVSPNPPTLLSQQPISAAATPVGKHRPSIHPPALRRGPTQTQGKKLPPERAEKPSKGKAKSESSYKAVRKVMNKEAALTEATTPVDLALPFISSSSLSSISSPSCSSHLMPLSASSSFTSTSHSKLTPSRLTKTPLLSIPSSNQDKANCLLDSEAVGRNPRKKF